MTPVQQRIVDKGIGDCLKCCVASLLDLSYEEVPHFILESEEAWFHKFIEFLKSKGYRFSGTVNETESNGVNGYFIAFGPSYRFKHTTHAVITDKVGNLVYDPHPSQKGIPSVMGYYLIEKGE